MNDPLDFEREDELLKAPSINKKRFFDSNCLLISILVHGSTV